MRSASEQVSPVPSGSTFNDLTTPFSRTIEYLFERTPPEIFTSFVIVIILVIKIKITYQVEASQLSNQRLW